MTKREQQLEYCKICRNRKFNLDHGYLCGLTEEHANFEVSCNDFEEDEEESKRLIALKLAAAGQNGVGSPSDFRKNKEIGLIIFLLGATISFFSVAAADETGLYLIPFGAVIWGGIQCYRGFEQEKVFREELKKRKFLRQAVRTDHKD